MTKPITHHPVSGVPLTALAKTGNPCSDMAADYRPYAGQAPQHGMPARWIYNPWTGARRAAPDTVDDPYGLLIDAVSAPAPAEPVVPAVDRRVEDRRAPASANPKDAAGRAKVPLWLLSPVAKAAWALAQFAGLKKYGAWNWRGTEVLASVYLSAAMRHLDAYLSGETHDPEDGTHHLGNVMACCAILLDAAACGKLIDDRPPFASHRPAYDAAKANVARLDAQYADRDPKHWTIADSVATDTLPASPNKGDNHVTAARPVPPAGYADGARSQDRDPGAQEAGPHHRV